MNRINFRNWKFWVILGSVLILVALITLGIIYYFSFYTKIDKPTGLQVVSLSNGETYIQVDTNDRAVKYEFRIQSQSQDEPQILESKKNILKVTSYFNTVGEFTISCKILGAISSANSDYCDSISYKKEKKLATPVIEINQNRLYFTLDDNLPENLLLDFFLYYGSDGTNILKDNLNYAIISSNAGMVYGYFDLNFLANGEYSLSVKAEVSETNNDLYLSSDLSTQVIFLKN